MQRGAADAERLGDPATVPPVGLTDPHEDGTVAGCLRVPPADASQLDRLSDGPGWQRAVLHHLSRSLDCQPKLSDVARPGVVEQRALSAGFKGATSEFREMPGEGDHIFGPRGERR